jgi:Na+-transporting methylmalonyl-CoA/oxaloacetate decarboxylase gamma subunit
MEELAMTSETAGAGPEELHRPGVLRWLWYALGGGLPERHSAWVLHDTTTGSWGVRHVLRAAVQMAVPVALVLLVLLGLIFSIAYMTETTENRVKKAGYAPGSAQAVRDRAQLGRDAERTAKRRAAEAKRAARYRERQGR